MKLVMFSIMPSILTLVLLNIAIIDVKRGIEMFKRTNVKILGIIENMTSFISDDGIEHFIFGKDGGKKIASKFNIKLIGQIPLNTELRISCDVGVPYTCNIQEDKISKIFANIANEIIKEIN